MTGWNYDNEVTYPFGHGLSYSTFKEEIVEAKIDLNGDSVFKIKVTNTGSVSAKHAVQLYVSAPYEKGMVEKSAIQLIGYAKTGDTEELAENYTYDKVVNLKPSQEEILEITVPNTYFASYDENEGNGAYILDSGDYYFAIGNSAHDAINNVLKSQGKLNGDSSTSTYKYNNENKIVINKSHGGSEFKNNLESADLNKYKDVNVTYLSRSDWAGTFPKTLSNLTATEEMINSGLKNSTYNPKDYENVDVEEHTFGVSGQMGTSIVDLAGLEFDDPEFDQVINSIPLKNMVKQYGQGFQVLQSISEINMPAVNANGTTNGQGATLGKYNTEGDYVVKGANSTFDCRIFPLETVLASSFSHRIAALVGDTIGNQSLWTGLNWWYGVGSNLHRTPYNGRNMDYYSEDSILSGIMALDECKATEKYGVITGMKHFAFNTTESHRTGLSIYFNEQSARENELRSFQLAIESGSVDSIMTSYSRVGGSYSSADHGFLTEILRNEMGYKGIVITDLVQATSYYVLPKEALSAGTDIIMSSSAQWEGWDLSTVENDKYLRDCMYKAWHHLLYATANSNVINTVSKDTRIVRVYPWWEQTLISGIVVFWTLTLACLGLGLTGNILKSKKGIKDE